MIVSLFVKEGFGFEYLFLLLIVGFLKKFSFLVVSFSKDRDVGKGKRWKILEYMDLEDEFSYELMDEDVVKELLRLVKKYFVCY